MNGLELKIKIMGWVSSLGRIAYIIFAYFFSISFSFLSLGVKSGNKIVSFLFCNLLLGCCFLLLLSLYYTFFLLYLLFQTTNNII